MASNAFSYEDAIAPATTVAAPVPVQTAAVPPVAGASPSANYNAPFFSYEDAAQGAPAAALPVSQSLGFQEQASKPLDNVAGWVDKIPGASALDEALAHLFGTPTTAQAIAQRQQAFADAEKTARPGGWGKMAGDVVGTLPTLMLPGGPLLQGAAGGALLTDHPNDPARIAGDAALGAVAGKAMDVGGKALINTVAPTIGASARMLLGAKVPLTTDMMTGGKGLWGWAGKVAGITPGAGELYRMRGNEALAGASPGFANAAMAPINPGIGAVDNGAALYASARGAKDAAYSAVGDGLNVPLDGAYAARMQPVRSDVSALPADLQGRYARVVGRELNLRVDPTTGEIPSGALADAKVGINKDIAKFPNPSGWDADYVDALKSTRRALVDSLGDTSPEARSALNAADAAYPGYKTVQAAVRKANLNSTTQDAFPTAQHMLSAVRENSSPEAFAAGTAPGQQYAQAAKDILPRKFKDVVSPMQSLIEGGIGAGVIGSDVLGHAGPVLMGAQAAMLPLYLKGVQDALRKGLLSSANLRAAAERNIGSLENYVPAPAALSGGLLSQRYSNPVWGQSGLLPAYAQ